LVRNYKAAIAHFHKELETNPHNEKALFGLGFALLKEKKPKEAIGVLKSALEINKNLYEVTL
jgi:tetratricopeptide (TPR) repeat protein